MTYRPFQDRHPWLQGVLYCVGAGSFLVGVVAGAREESWAWMLLVPTIASCVLLCVWYES